MRFYHSACRAVECHETAQTCADSALQVNTRAAESLTSGQFLQGCIKLCDLMLVLRHASRNIAP